MVSRITCPPDSDLRRLIDGSAPEGEANTLTNHLDGCEVCRVRLDRLAGGSGSWAVLGALADRTTNPAPQATDEEEPVPTTVGPYQILGVIGTGGMGRVYKAYDPALRRIVAVKVMARELAGNATARKRFLREARAAAAVCHEHVVPVHAVEEGDPVPYIVMQFVPGRSLQERLIESGPPELRAIVRIGMQAAQGLAAAHAQGIVHRDVKPANILLENGVERVKLTDFGLARAADDVRVSRSGQFAGTPLYASPEQASGEEVDSRSDLFSLGSVLYELCTGRPAFPAPTPMAVLKKVCDSDPKPIRYTNPDVPEWLCAVIEKLLAKETAQRFQTAQEVAELLEQYLAHLNQPAISPHPPKVEVPRRRGSRRRWFTAIGLVAVALAFAAVIVVRVQTDHGEVVIEADDDAAEVITKRGGVTVKDIKTGRSYTVRPGKQRLGSGEYEVEVTEPESGLTFATTRFVISRGRTQPIRVTFTPRQLPVGPSFALLPHGGGAEQGFHTLNEAIASAPAGATVEVRGDGPFDVLPITLTKPIRIRAAPGRAPIIRMMPDAWKVTSRLITTTASLSLEGLEFDRRGVPTNAPIEEFLTATDHTGRAEIRIANCRFRYGPRPHFLIGLTGIGTATFRDCEFLGDSPSTWAIAVDSMTGGSVTVEGCVIAGYGLSLGRTAAFPARGVDVVISRNTWLTSHGSEVPIGLNQFDRGVLVLPPEPAYRVRAVENVFVPNRLTVATWKFPKADPKPDPASELEDAFVKLVRWTGERNVYAAGSEFLGGTSWAYTDPVFTKSRTTLADWTALPNVREEGSTVTRLSFVSDDPRDKHRKGALVATDFAPTSQEAKERGADPSRVGPGAAYEAFRRSVAYAEWDRVAGFTREALRPWDSAFLVRSAGTDKRYASFIAACESAPPGAVIEVLNDGPFQVLPVALTKPLTVRSAAGTRPKFVLSPLALSFATMIETNSSLVLEGLEFSRRDRLPWQAMTKPPAIIRSDGGDIRLANCRLLTPTDALAVITHGAQAFEAVNCEFVYGGSVFWMGGVSVDSLGKGSIQLANCTAIGGGSALCLWQPLHDRRDVEVRLEQNTFRTTNPLVLMMQRKTSEDPLRTIYRLDGKHNLFFGGESVLRFEQSPTFLRESQNRRLTPEQIRAILPRLVSWQIANDTHVAGREGFFTASAFGQKYRPKQIGGDVTDWRKWWGFHEGEPGTDAPIFAGESLLVNPGERLTDIRPEDFRVKAWDAAKGSAPGVDVDLVGPGPGYERWKKTPEYAEWCKRTTAEK